MKIRLVSGAGLLIAAAACGGQARGGAGAGRSAPDGGMPPNLSGLAGRLAAAVCDAFARCSSPEITAVLNGKTCLEFETATIENTIVPLFADGLARGTILDTPDRVDPCLAALQVDCKSLESGTFCNDWYPGKLKAGEACLSNEECEHTLYCNWGATCPGVCEARLPLNAVCRWDSDCEGSLRCNLGAMRCVGVYDINLTAGSGATCNPTSGQLCRPGLSCALTFIDGISPVYACEAPPSDGSCHWALPEQCPAGQFCALNTSSAAAGTCQTAPKVGEPCGSIDPTRPGTECEKGSVCDVTVRRCVALTANGGTCTANDQCYSGNCYNGACMSPKCAP